MFSSSNKVIFKHHEKEVTFEHCLYPVTKPRAEGHLKVSDIHTLFYAVYGNPDGIPAVILHGGPGAGCDDSLCRFFDLDRWNVVMFDQRGTMRSQPFACMEENTPQHSIDDIETLRKHLGIEKWLVFGGSWGSALSLLYGQAHPTKCLGFVLRGIFLGREQDYLHLLYGMGKVFPEEYDIFVNFISEEERNDLLPAFYRRIMDIDPNVHMPAARAFMRFSVVCSSLFPNPAAIQRLLKNDQIVISTAKAFFYYSMHGFFLEPNQILSRMETITDLPAILVEGRWDAVCPPEMTYLLYQKWNNCMLWMNPKAGHSANPVITAALATATDQFAEELKR